MKTDKIALLEEERQQLLDKIEEKIYASPDLLAAELGLPQGNVQKELDALENEYEVAKSKHGKYALASTMGLFRGTMECKKGGFAFLRTPHREEDIFIGASGKHGALDGEEVLVKLRKHQEEGRNLEGTVVKVLSALPYQTVGTVEKTRNVVFVISDDPAIDDVFIPKQKAKGLRNGQKVVFNITRRADGNRSPEGEIAEVLGNSGEKGVDILAYARRFGLTADFDEECNAQAKKLSQEQPDTVGRLDLRKSLVVTIDGADAKDLDDAVSLQILPNGNYELGVHIADVSHYVREGTPLDQEALKRGTSVYMVDRVVPMLPKEISNGICSLNPAEDKLTLSCIMEINPQGETVSHRIENTVIRSRYRLTYEAVNKILAGDKREASRFAQAADMLFAMDKLAKIMRERRFEKGSIDFNIDEAEILLDEKGKPKDVVLRQRGDAEKLIEEFMLRANVTVAQQAFYMDMPFVYRVHEQPDADKMKELSIFLGNFGIKLKGFQNVHPRAIQSVLSQAENTDEAAIVNRVALRSLKKAKYTTEPEGHFGLAAERYCHFTSPIRRYPDLQIHRILKQMLEKGIDEGIVRHYERILPEVAAKSSERERNAIEAERAVQDLKMTEYMSQFVGQEFPAIVSGVTRFGIFAELENTIEGMIPLAQLHDDYYDYREKEYCAVGEKTKKRITLGDKITIRVAAADVASGKIEFTLVEK
ncbi:MAG: ribonuclease R [Christensenella sp.]|nr:ribonuclease R [Christensenella sp.]